MGLTLHFPLHLLTLCALIRLEGGEAWPAELRGLAGRLMELETHGPSPSGGPGLAGELGAGARGGMGLAVSGDIRKGCVGMGGRVLEDG